LLDAVGTPFFLLERRRKVFQQTAKNTYIDFQHINILLEHLFQRSNKFKKQFKLIFNILKFCWNVGTLEQKITDK
jgi:hypothetical protein